MFSMYAYMFYSGIKYSQYLKYFTSLWLAKFVIYVMHHIYYCLLLIWGDWMSRSKSSLCHLSG